MAAVDRPMTSAGSDWLLAGGVLSAGAALMHAAIIVGGPAWYRFFGAGERMAKGAANGRWEPAAVFAVIAGVLAVWSVYALSGAGLLPRLPVLRPGLVAVAAVYLARGAVLFRPGLLRRPDLSRRFVLWSSAIALAIGLVHVVGIWLSWQYLGGTI